MKHATDIFEDSTIEEDPTGTTLLALSELSSISDDLYTVLGEDNNSLNEDQRTIILDSFELLSSVHENLSKSYKFPSDDLDEFDISEDLFDDNDIEEFDEDISTIFTWEDGSDALLEVTKFDSSKVMSILVDLLPKNSGEGNEASIGFKSVEDRDAAADALVDYFKTVKEEAVETVSLGEITEGVDATKFKRLANTGLVSSKDVPSVITAIKLMDAGKTLNATQKDLITSTFLSLIELVTGDSSVFTKITAAASKNQSI